MSEAERVRVAVLISGAGSNMAALIDAAADAGCAYRVVAVISNKPTAGGLAVAAGKGVAAYVVDSGPVASDREAHEAAIQTILDEEAVEIVALAGYMRILSRRFTDRWHRRMLNIHPSLLPRHPGLDTHRRALAAGEAEAGCTVHVVTSGVDEGPILAQARTPILEDDTPASLAQRVLTLEHQLYPATLDRYCADWSRFRPDK